MDLSRGRRSSDRPVRRYLLRETLILWLGASVVLLMIIPDISTLLIALLLLPLAFLCAAAMGALEALWRSASDAWRGR